MIIQFRTNTKYIKLTESNVYNTITVRFNTRSGDYTVYEIMYQSYTLFILTETESPLNILVSLSKAFADKAHRAEEQFRRLKPRTNTLKSPKFRFGTHRPTFLKRVRQYFKSLKQFVKKKDMQVTPPSTQSA